MVAKKLNAVIMNPKRNFETPEDLYNAFKLYKEDVKERAKEWGRVQYVGKDGDRKEDYPNLPYTFAGFKVFCYDRYGTVEHYFTNKDNLYTDYVSICTRIKEEIRDRQITGGLLGEYNSSITQRLNALKEHTEVKADVKASPMFGEDSFKGL